MTPSELERRHLILHAQTRFPGAMVTVVQDIDNEVIHLVIDGATFTFEIGSDDDRYRFVASGGVFDIPLMPESPADMADTPSQQ